MGRSAFVGIVAGIVVATARARRASACRRRPARQGGGDRRARVTRAIGAMDTLRVPRRSLPITRIEEG